MRKKNTKNILFMLGGGFVSKLIPSQNMHKVGQTPSGVGIYTASADVLRTYYPDLYAQRPGAKGYIFTGNGTTFTPSKSGAKGIDNYIDIELLKKYTPGYTSNEQNQSNRNTTDNVDNNIYTGPEGDEVVVTPEKNGTINDYDYGNNLSTYGNGRAASAYDPNSELVRPNIERLLYWDPVNKQIRDRQLSERLSSYTPYNFLSTIIPAHLADPMNYLGAAGEYFRGNDNFFLNVLSGNNQGMFSLSDNLYNWANKNPNLSALANFVGSAATLRFVPKIPRLLSRGKVGSSINSAFETVGNFANRALNYSTGVTNGATRYVANTAIGRPFATMGRNVVNWADNFANQVYLRIPQSVKGAVSNVQNFATLLKPTSLIENSIKRVTNLSLSPLARTGLGASYALGTAAYDIGKDYFNNLDINWFNLSKFAKYFPFVNAATKPVDYYNKANAVVNAAGDIADNGLTPENTYKTINTSINTLSTENSDKQS